MTSPLIKDYDNWLGQMVGHFRTYSRMSRASLFYEHFKLTNNTKILDLGGWNGAHIQALLSGSPVEPANIYLADISQRAVNEGALLYGFTPIVILKDGRIPYPDKFFDIVFSSSVIEHVTVPKKMVWGLTSGSRFQSMACESQNKFAAEIRRLGKNYFVQTPYRWFFFETHTWVPFFSYLPRRIAVPLVRLTNSFWIKKTTPNFFLLTEKDMNIYFPDALIIKERVLCMTKSLIALHKS
jgi:SAM-dependent methyltransferase